MSLISTTATIIGSYVNIKRGSKINSITVKIGNGSPDNKSVTGRHLGLAYWVVNSEFNKQNMLINPSNPNGAMNWFSSVSSTHINSINLITYNDGQRFEYIDTNLIPKNTSEDVTFYFNNSEEINESKIFVALIATRGTNGPKDYDDVSYAWTTYEADSGSVRYDKASPVDSNEKLIPSTGRGLTITNLDVTLVSSSTDSGSTNKPSPIKCTKLQSRTWSLLKDARESGSTNNHQISVLDGGEDCGYLYGNSTNRNEIKKNNKRQTFNYTTLNNTKKSASILPYIMNDDDFSDDYEMPEGRLSDIDYANPSQGGLTLSGVSVTQPRWCFKRSRIKFTIPGITNAKYGTVVQYVVRTPITKKGIYSSTPKKKFYTKTETQNGFDIVICPRDEGVLDNMPFEVVFSRQYASSKSRTIGYKSDNSVYKFHTYQKPIVNITYPKIVRNDSTWEGNESRNFKYAKIPTSNIYSNFDGENAIRNKYVCDALTVLFSTPKNDGSGIPMFVRFYVAEFKYGRDGCLEDNSFNTTQDLFKSHDMSKYTSLNDILNGTFKEDDRTAYVTNIFNNDGSPLLLSGRFNARTLKEVGENYKLWTFNTWDYVVDDDEMSDATGTYKDVRVHNAWELTKTYYDENGEKKNKVISKDIVGDHKAKGIITDIDAEKVSYPVSKMLLFRAGYCYLIRIRMFHGAAAGAIGAKYASNNETCLGKRRTGIYNYSDAFYSGSYPVNDSPKYGSNNPYVSWKGPDDGTGGLSLTNVNLNETFPGFSQVDYTMFEATAPYTSTSNLITVHPTSPNVSVNQCLSFNYRHLAKNIGGMDTTIYSNEGFKSGYFGRTFGGIHNTVSRVMAMYTSCVETILGKYFAVRGTNPFNYYAPKLGAYPCTDSGDITKGTVEKSTLREKLTLKINAIDANGRQLSISNGFKLAQTNSSESKVPLLNEYEVKDIKVFGTNDPNDSTALVNWDFYTHDYAEDGVPNKGNKFKTNGIICRCGCYEFNNYRNDLLSHPDKINNNSPGNTNILTSTPGNADVWNWGEMNIIYKMVTAQSDNEISEEPLGNVYRWQPVINAVNYDNNKTTEIQIQGKNNDKVNSFAFTNCIGSTGGSVQCSSILYNGTNNVDGGIQKEFYYEDKTPSTLGSKMNMSNYVGTTSNRFTINEFAGIVTGSYYSSGWPTMQTMPSTNEKHYKYFDINSTLNTYGNLFSRIPSTCDCENGVVTKDTINFGSLGRFSDNNLLGYKDIYSLDNDGKNVYPLVRTTHYLYYKTHINVAFTLKADVQLKYTSGDECTETTSTSSTGETTTTHTHSAGDKEVSGIFYFNSTCTDMNKNDNGEYDSNNIITFGNNNGIAEVYGEDNNGWGRCLSADDSSAMKFRPDGSMNAHDLINGHADSSKMSGGIEVPLLVRYTPLLQPRLIGELVNSNLNKEPCSKSVTIKEDKYYNASKVLFNDGSNEVETDKIGLKIVYPYIPEDETYTTRNINGGLDKGWFAGYYVDNDTDTPNDRNESVELTNMDFLGGFGICTAYTVLLVPSDPNLDTLKNKTYSGYNGKYLINGEIDKYFKNTDGHWNYFKQPNNYYKNGHIFELRSKSQPEAGPVLVAYCAQTSDLGEFLNNNAKDSDGRNKQTIDLDINKLRKCMVYYKNEWLTTDKFNNKTDVKANYISLNKVYNKLNTGVIYDLVIVPIYSNVKDKSYAWVGGSANSTPACGTINGQTYGSNKADEKTEEIHFAGSNPLVLFNYLQVSANIINTSSSDDGGGDPTPKPDPGDKNPKDEYKIHDVDGGIVFPNVDHEKFNMTSGNVKESPGFWLNNSFKLILRLPSYRTNNTKIESEDNITIENASGGEVTTKADDFRFKDIQIHIGKYKELIDYCGTADKMETTLNKITDKDELAKLHIFSYKDYYIDGVFSKRLNDEVSGDPRELATAGSLNPKDADYHHRFIEVNLANAKIKNDLGEYVPIFTEYPEGYYIQFRVQSAYATNEENYNWSQWYGGSCDGGSKWWGEMGTDYFVPVRDYSEIFTEFRNYIKDCFPGSNLEIGKGSLNKYAGIDENSKTKPKSALLKKYFKRGLGNNSKSSIVGSDVLTYSNSDAKTVKTYVLNNGKYSLKTINISSNNDWPYKGEENYKKSHDSTISLTYINDRLYEMLYVDFVIRNLCKLYYKPNYNNNNDKWSKNNNLTYHLSVPYKNGNPIILDSRTWGWDISEYNLFKTNTNNIGFDNHTTRIEDKSSNENHINGLRKQKEIDLGRWNLNKYYRKPINKQDFDELNRHLMDLSDFICDELLSGKTTGNEYSSEIKDILPIYSSEIDFEKTRKAMIGSSLSFATANGIGNVNNLNNQLTDINYVQKIWDNIKLLCQCYKDSEIEQ